MTSSLFSTLFSHKDYILWITKNVTNYLQKTLVNILNLLFGWTMRDLKIVFRCRTRFPFVSVLTKLSSGVLYKTHLSKNTL